MGKTSLALNTVFGHDLHGDDGIWAWGPVKIDHYVFKVVSQNLARHCESGVVAHHPSGWGTSLLEGIFPLNEPIRARLFLLAPRPKSRRHHINKGWAWFEATIRANAVTMTTINHKGLRTRVGVCTLCACVFVCELAWLYVSVHTPVYVYVYVCMCPCAFVYMSVCFTQQQKWRLPLFLWFHWPYFVSGISTPFVVLLSYFWIIFYGWADWFIREKRACAHMA